MRIITLGISVLLVAAAVTAKDNPAPDFASMDKQVLVVLARNQHHTIGTLRTLIAELKNLLLVTESARATISQKATRHETRVVELEAQLAELHAMIEADPEIQAKVQKYEKIKKAITDHEILVGMTLVQANMAMGYDGELIEDGDSVQVYEWNRYRKARTTALPPSTYRTPQAPSGESQRLLTGLAESSRERQNTEARERFYATWKDMGKHHYIVDIIDGVVRHVSKYD